MKKTSKVLFDFIVSRGSSEVFNVSIFANNEIMAREKLRNVIGWNQSETYKAKIRNITEMFG